MATLLEQLLALATAGTMMISSALNTAAPQNDINGLLFLQNRQWRVSAAYIPEVREAELFTEVTTWCLILQPVSLLSTVN